jgi:histidinol-phosphate aminotransferase
MIDSRARAVLRDLAMYQPGGSLDAAKKRLKRASVIKLASNENALGPSPKAVAALRRVTGGLHRYPDAGCTELRAKLATHWKLRPESVIVGNGSDELIVLALRAFVDPGDHVVVATPTFLIYELQAKACGASITPVALRHYRYDLSAMRQAIEPHTKLVFVANPDNPTGTYVTKQELAAFLRDLPGEVIVFLDEAYYEFVEASDYPQTVPYVREGRSVIVTRSFSKAYGLAGLRIGYGFAPSPIIAAMNAVREPFNVNSLAQAAAVAALKDRAYLARTRATLREGRRYLMKSLEALHIRYVPSVANFLLIELGPRASEIAQALLAQGVMVRDMRAWQLDHCLRVTLGTMAENRTFIQALKRCLGG